MVKVLLLAAGGLCVTLGLVGIFIPILPTTPFLLLAAFFFARGSDRALGWLLHNRWFGPYISNYRSGLGIALRDKVITLSLLWFSIAACAVFLIEIGWLRLLLVAVAAGVSIHILRMRTYRPGSRQDPPRAAAELD